MFINSDVFSSTLTCFYLRWHVCLHCQIFSNSNMLPTSNHTPTSPKISLMHLFPYLNTRMYSQYNQSNQEMLSFMHMNPCLQLHPLHPLPPPCPDHPPLTPFPNSQPVFLHQKRGGGCIGKHEDKDLTKGARWILHKSDWFLWPPCRGEGGAPRPWEGL